MKAMKNSVVLFLAILIAMPLSCMAQKTNCRYQGTTSVFVPYVNAKTNIDLEVALTVNIGFNGIAGYHAFIMDTGSVGIVASPDIFQPAPGAQNLGPGEQYYDSSGIIEKGTIWTATQQIYDPHGNLLATADVPVLQVTQVVCINGSCPPNNNPTKIAIMGIGLAREGNDTNSYPPPKTPAYNPFLNLTKVLEKGKLKRLPKDWVNGYVVYADGVDLGLTSANTAHAGFVKLKPWPQFSTPKLSEWMLAPMTVKINGVSGNGNSVFDTGIKNALVFPPSNANLGTLVNCPGNSMPQCVGDGNVFSIYFPNEDKPVAFYTFTVGQTGNPMQPDSVQVVSRSGVFFNTSRHLLGGMNYIYDNTNGYVGYIWNGNTSSQYGYVKPSK
jgi:hypothetical protein